MNDKEMSELTFKGIWKKDVGRGVNVQVWVQIVEFVGIKCTYC